MQEQDDSWRVERCMIFYRFSVNHAFSSSVLITKTHRRTIESWLIMQDHKQSSDPSAKHQSEYLQDQIQIYSGSNIQIVDPVNRNKQSRKISVQLQDERRKSQVPILATVLDVVCKYVFSIDISPIMLVYMLTLLAKSAQRLLHLVHLHLLQVSLHNQPKQDRKQHHRSVQFGRSSKVCFHVKRNNKLQTKFYPNVS